MTDTPSLRTVAEGLRAALQAKSEAYHSAFIREAGPHRGMAWSNCTSATCEYDRRLLAALDAIEAECRHIRLPDGTCGCPCHRVQPDAGGVYYPDRTWGNVG